MATVFKGGNVVDGSGQRPMFVGDVVVEGALITAVHDYADGEPAAYPAGAAVIDCAGKEVTPGWIDQHTHYVRFPLPCTLGLRLHIRNKPAAVGALLRAGHGETSSSTRGVPALILPLRAGWAGHLGPVPLAVCAGRRHDLHYGQLRGEPAPCLPSPSRPPEPSRSRWALRRAARTRTRAPSCSTSWRPSRTSRTRP